ncbi:MAG: alpha/beta fold hydrolase [Actinomycetota bacterium]
MREIATQDRASAHRVDGDTQIDACFFGPDDARLFGTLHTPSHTPRAGVLVCSPLHADFAKNYAKEVRLARSLARDGFSVLRFHYRGQGHSDGDQSEITLESLVQDCRIALHHLQSSTGVRRFGFVGCRLGGFVAAAAASDASSDGAPLVLWEPVLKPDRYVREAIRSRVISSLSGVKGEQLSSDTLMTYLHERGSVDIHGYPIYRALLESFEDRSLFDELGSTPRAVHVVQIGKSSTVRGDVAAVIGEWSRLGFAADVRCVIGEIAWWFGGASRPREEPERLAEEVVGDTVEWLTGQFVREGRS